MRLDHALVLVVTALGGCDAAVTDALDEGQGDLDVDAASAPAVDMTTVAVEIGRVDLGGARDLAVKRDLAMPDGAMPDLAEQVDLMAVDLIERADLSGINCTSSGDCPIAKDTVACVAGYCSISSCMGGYKNCNGLVMDGCEIDAATDRNNCGACGAVCTFGDACVGGRCCFSAAGARCSANADCCSGLCASNGASNVCR